MGNMHDISANRLANKLKTKHNRKGVDIRHKEYAIEVAVNESDVYSSIGQLKRSRKNIKYLAIPEKFMDLAIRITKNTGIGVMNLNRNIKKKARRKNTY